MAKKKDMELGFDLPKAIESLRQAAVAEGAFSPEDPSGNDPALVALAHMHGIEHERQCLKNPCRLGALCLALQELLQYQSEKPRADVLSDFGIAGAALDSASQRLERAAMTTGWNGKPVCSEAHRDRLVELRREIERVCTQVEQLAEGVILAIWTPQLLQPPDKKRAELLLRALWQHLEDGGFTHEEAFELVPTLGPYTKAKDIVRKRVKESDARSLLPRERHPDLYEPPQVDKRRRRRSSA